MKLIDFKWMASALLASVLVAGCNPPSPETQDTVKKTAQDLGDKAEKTGQNIAKSFDENKEATNLKMQLDHAKDLDSSNLKVNVIDKTIHIMGSVPDEKQKSRAMQIINAIKDPDYKTSDELTVKPADQPQKP